MKAAADIDVKAIRAEYDRTHTGTANMSIMARGRGQQKIDVSDEEAEFGHALGRYKRENHRPLPNYGEVLAVLLALGYRQVAEPAPLKEKG